MKYRQATNADLVGIQELLNDNDLSSSDCGEHLDNFIIMEEKNKIIGIGGIEIYGCYGLIRSIVVAQNQRGCGIAKDIFQIIKEKAFDMGVTGIYLLTETANEYFKKLGFRAVKRSEVPEEIMNTKQFKELCPSSAVVMYFEI